MRKPTKSKLIRLSLLLLVAGIALPAGGKTVSANYFNNLYDNIQQFSGLPEEINQLKNNYNQALQELDKARIASEQLQQQNVNLAEQNSNLAEQNQQLTQMVGQLQEAEAARKRGAERLKTVAITAVALAAGYFVIIRVLRFGMRRTNRLK
ncbi:hypothetical protein [Paenibacillus glucanolyticus]|uniref:hypothetical protein n=1 Tax=Paenibacillus glucanolyticus TaxID=59843 RepID=UPI00096EF4D8|nr:hypothetical protein [Paenibacillus glucanolyticus]OMF68376.1 hypothetical protein BK142_27785 [Paenibacillus glucanolyticus]